MRCRVCGAAVRQTARFCDQCGVPLDDPNPAARATPPSDAPGAGDRRIVTALFADLVDYVRLVAEHDAEDVRRRVNAALAAIVEAIEDFGGTREKFIGDAVFAVFGWPVSHGDDALRAAHCALAIVEALTHVDESTEQEPLQVRIGLATGEVVAAPRGSGSALDWSLTGPAITTAARIQVLAEPGEILLDDATLQATRKEFDVEDRGRQLLRGQRRPIRIARLLGGAGFQPWRPPIGGLIGRDGERARLRELLTQVGPESGVAVVIEGEAGIGKSRLMADLATDARAAGLAWTWVDNVSYGMSEPYRFGRSLAQAIAEEHQTDSGSMARRLLFSGDVQPADASRWAGAIAAMARDAAFSGWEAEASLAPAEPSEVASAVRDVSVRYMERLIEVSGPRAIVIDDLHWLDPSSAGMVEELILLTERTPLLVILGTRPRSSTTSPGLDRVERLVLEGLNESETRRLAGAIVGAEVATVDARRIHARTAGNPFFISETVRALVESQISSGADGSPFGGDLSAGGLPDTIRSLLGSRIDGLSEEAQAVLRIGSVVGMRFRDTVVAHVLGRPVERATYRQLVRAGLIRRIGPARGWTFAHQLIHDAAYSSVLATSRRQFHAGIADWLESSRTRVPIGVLARHRAAAGDVRAVPLLAKAASEALTIGAAAEAASLWTAAADLVGADAKADDYRQLAREALELVSAPPPAAG